MRHNKKTFTLGRNKAQKKALMRSLANSLIIHESIRTTKAKAKVLRTIVEPIITRAKRGNIFDKRCIAKVLYTKDAIKKIMEDFIFTKTFINIKQVLCRLLSTQAKLTMSL